MADIILSSYISLRISKFSGFNIKKLINQPEKIKGVFARVRSMQSKPKVQTLTQERREGAK